jgi:hypothetical protein
MNPAENTQSDVKKCRKPGLTSLQETQMPFAHLCQMLEMKLLHFSACATYNSVHAEKNEIHG